jgi:two-component system sensor histidine kinase MprB
VSLRWRIALALAAIAAATTTAVGVASYRATSDRLMKAIDTELLQALRAGGANLAELIDQRGPFDVYFFQLVSRSGRVETGSWRQPVGPGPGPEKVRSSEDVNISYDTVETDDGDVRLLTAEAGRVDVQLGRSLAENERLLDDLRTRTILLIVVVTAAAAALGWLIATSVTGPLVRLTKAATDVERSGRLDVQVPVSGKDEVGRLGEAFNGMLGALASSRDDQRRLVEDAGHELRTPLTSVRTNLAVLRRHPDLDPATRAKVLDDLHAETEELVGLVEEVVALARGVTDGAPVERVELGALARTVAGRAERRHGRPVTVTADDSHVDAPPSEIERAISNLVDNAAKFDPSGQPIEIEVASGRLVVHDRGPGIAPADQSRLFDRFYRADPARALPGSGLGLSIVRDVVERHGGTVQASARPGGGASIGFTLPVVES